MAMKPRVARTAVSASRIGIPAATSAPNAMIRMISVIGTEMSPAFFRSSMKDAVTSFVRARVAELADEERGVSGRIAATSATTGSIWSPALSNSPRIWKSMIAERPSSEICAALVSPSGARRLITCSSPSSRAAVSSIAAANSGSLAVSVSLWMRTVSPAGCLKPASRIWSARLDSPAPPALPSAAFVPTTVPSMTASTTKASQPKTAVFQWPALQRPMRPAMFVGGVG